MVQHGAEGVLAVRGRDGEFDGLGNGTAQGAPVVGVPGNDVLSGAGGHGRGRGDGSPEGLHDRAAVGLLLIADLDHVDGAVDAELLGGVGQRTAPLAGAGLGGQVRDALLLGIVGLGDGGVELVAAGRRDTLILEIDMRRGSEGLFELIGTHERGATIGGILLADGFRDGDPFVGLVQFLIGAGLAEDGVEVFGFERLLGAGMQERHGLVGHDRLDVEEMGRNLGLREQEFFLSHLLSVLRVNSIIHKKRPAFVRGQPWIPFRSFLDQCVCLEECVDRN